MLTTTPDVFDSRFDSEEAPRYAVQRTIAARRGLPTRLLMNRARSEGEAHRRLEESSEVESPFAHPGHPAARLSDEVN